MQKANIVWKENKKKRNRPNIPNGAMNVKRSIWTWVWLKETARTSTFYGLICRVCLSI